VLKISYDPDREPKKRPFYRFSAQVHFYTAWAHRVGSLRRGDSAAIGGRADARKPTAGPHARDYSPPGLMSWASWIPVALP